MLFVQITMRGGYINCMFQFCFSIACCLWHLRSGGLTLATTNFRGKSWSIHGGCSHESVDTATVIRWRKRRASTHTLVTSGANFCCQTSPRYHRSPQRHTLHIMLLSSVLLSATSTMLFPTMLTLDSSDQATHCDFGSNSSSMILTGRPLDHPSVRIWPSKSTRMWEILATMGIQWQIGRAHV